MFLIENNACLMTVRLLKYTIMSKILDVLKLHEKDIEKLDGDYRRNLMNSLSGFKGANLIGSSDIDGNNNLAIFNSVMHIGANPAYMGIVMRPASVPRHTYNNIKETLYFTINSVHKSFFEKAHQTSAKYPSNLSEFEEVGLTASYGAVHKAPYVAESAVKIGLVLAEELPVKSNGTVILIGKVIELEVDPTLVAADGFVNLCNANTMSVIGLDAYCEPKLVDRLEYARPGKDTKSI